MITKKRPLIDLTTKLADIPRIWLQMVEPRLTRSGTCWLWDGATFADGEPLLNYTNVETGKRNTRRVKRIIADIFWEMKDHYDIVHACGNTNCLNPAHFYISVLHHSQEDRDRIIAEKSRNIRDYVNRNSK